MTAHEAPERPLRSDAERNRQRILTAAAAVFAERGLGVSLDDIAVAAGVGVGTVYRRFPDKDSLIEALFEQKIHGIEKLARTSLEIEDPWEAFSGFMRAMSRMQAEDRGLKEALMSADRGHERLSAARDTIAPVATELLRRAQEAGAVRADLGPFDVPMMHFAVGYVADATRAVHPSYFERLVTILLDGLRPVREDTTEMPAEPLDRERFLTAISTKMRRS